MNEPAVLLHVGLPRCASTFLQERVFPRLGSYAHPASGEHGQRRHFWKHYLFRRDYDRERFLRHLSARAIQPASGLGRRIVSFEGFAALYATRRHNNLVFGEHLGDDYEDEHRRTGARRLHSAFEGARVLIVIREPWQRLLSEFRASAGRGPASVRGRSLHDFLRLMLSEGIGFDYDDIIDTYRDEFGAANVLVLPYEWLATEPDRFLAPILSLAGQTTDTLEIDTRAVNAAPANRRHLLAAIFAGRLQNRLAELPVVGRTAGRLAARLPIALLARAFLPHRDFEIEPELRRQLELSIAEHNGRLAKRVPFDLSALAYTLPIPPPLLPAPEEYRV